MFTFLLFIVVPVVVVITAIIVLYNRLVRGKNLVREAWSGIEVQLKRRHDLIPNLIETVKGYMQHERTLLSDIASLRSRSISAENVKEKGEAETALARSLRTLFAVAEAYPDLKANQNFMELQKNLSDLEDQIQLARRYYNGTARDFNITVESFPSNLIATIFGFKPVDFFEIEEEGDRAVPQVKF